MADDVNPLENLKLKISELQKQYSIKRDILKKEIAEENDVTIQMLQSEVNNLKEKIFVTQAEMRKMYLKQSNQKITADKQKVKTVV